MNKDEVSAGRALKVIYVLGFARSGTTVLGNLLGELEGFVHVGELCRLWKRAVRSKDKCGCGSRMETCPLWSNAFAMTFSRMNGGFGAAAESPGGEIERAWNIQRKAEAGTEWRDVMLSPRDNLALKNYARLMEELLHSVAEVSNARVVIDSSKLPKSGAYLKHMETITPFFLHVIRDSRGAVFSRQRRHARHEGIKTVLSPVTAVADCYRWSRSNLAAGVFGRIGNPGRHMLLRYEDFVSRPAATLEGIAEWVGEKAERLPLVAEHTARLSLNHTVSGNRNRFQTGVVSIHRDDRWKESLRTKDFLLITALTAPLLSKYGYPLKRGSEISEPSDDRQS